MPFVFGHRYHFLDQFDRESNMTNAVFQQKISDF